VRNRKRTKDKKIRKVRNMVRIKRASFAIALALIISMFAQIVSPALAEAPKYEKPLPVVSGSSSDPRTFTYNGHVVSQGFAVST
jgi:hypothetical protein